MTLENQDIIQNPLDSHYYLPSQLLQLVDVQPNVGSCPGCALSFTSYQLLVKDEP